MEKVYRTNVSFCLYVSVTKNSAPALTDRDGEKRGFLFDIKAVGVAFKSLTCCEISCCEYN